MLQELIAPSLSESCIPGDFQFIRHLKGGSQSILVRQRTGGRWVVKLNGNPQGSNVLANEFLAAAFAKYVGLPLTPSKAVFLDDSFFDNEDTWFSVKDVQNRPKSGMHFASRFLPDLSKGEVYEFLPSVLHSNIRNIEEFVGMLIFDCWAGNADTRQALYVEHEDGLSVHATFIDNGNFFGGADWTHLERASICLPHAHRQMLRNARRDLIHSWIVCFQDDLPDILRETIQNIPEGWYNGDTVHLTKVLLARLKALPTLMQDYIEHLEEEHTSFPGMRYDWPPNRDSKVLQLRGGHSWD